VIDLGRQLRDGLLVLVRHAFADHCTTLKTGCDSRCWVKLPPLVSC
jgi:hypothetical protein